MKPISRKTTGPTAGKTPAANAGKATAPAARTAATPKAVTPKTAAPKAATPKAATPKAAAPKAAAPKAATPKAATPKAATPKAATPKVAAPKATGPTARTTATTNAQKKAAPTAKTVATATGKATASTVKTAQSTSRNTVQSGKTLQPLARRTANKTTTHKTTAAKASHTETAKGLRDLFELGLKDIYYAEKVLAKNLPKMAKNATSPELVKELNNHLSITKEQVSRLEQVFKTTGIKPRAVRCDAMDGILKESNHMIEQTQKGVVRDAGIIASDQKVDHYEIVSYGTLHAYAKTLGELDAANLLSLTLDEAKKVDAALTRIAMTGINSQARNADAITTIGQRK